MELVIILFDESTLREDSVSFQNIVIPFLIKQKIFSQVPSFIKVSLNDKSHVAKGKIDVIPHQNEVMHFIVDSISVAKFELRFFEVFNIHFVTFQFASLFTIDNVVFLGQILVSPSILEEHGVFLHIEGFYFCIVFQVPDYNAIH